MRIIEVVGMRVPHGEGKTPIVFQGQFRFSAKYCRHKTNHTVLTRIIEGVFKRGLRHLLIFKVNSQGQLYIDGKSCRHSTKLY